MNNNQKNSNGDKKKRDESLFYISCDFVRLVSLFMSSDRAVFPGIRPAKAGCPDVCHLDAALFKLYASFLRGGIKRKTFFNFFAQCPSRLLVNDQSSDWYGLIGYLKKSSWLIGFGHLANRVWAIG